MATGLVRNEPEISIPEIKHYGYPLYWIVTNLNGPTEYVLTNLAIDAAFWFIISLLILIILERIAPHTLGKSVNYKSLFLPLVLFIPLGLIMDFVHELSHAVWGIAVGGRLTYMKISYLEIYPRFSLTSTFVLGVAQVEGLTTEFAYGLTSLGGSLTTNIVAWLLALLLLRVKFGYRTQVALKTLGFFGILDLPFYVLFPQMGLQHWIFLGGWKPEPLIGARKMDIPDPAFYITVVFSTFGLVILYFKPFWESAWKSMRNSEVWIFKVIPGLILFSLWLDGWFFPLILLPILYVLLVEKKSLRWLGFSRQGLRYSIIISALIAFALSVMYYPIFLHHLFYMLKRENFDLYSIFLEAIWYPLYEEIAYRSFALTHFADLEKSYLSTRNLAVNLSQSLLFLSLHKHYLSVPFVLVPVFLLGLLNGFSFLRTRNVYGCIVSHSALNSFALLLRCLQSG